MMKMIVPFVLVLLASAAGGFGASLLKGDSAPVTSEAALETESADPARGKAKKGDKTGSDAYGLETKSTYFKFSREFIIPIMRDAELTSLIILNISLEADANAGGSLFTQEPKIRDRIMTTLISISNDGVTLQSLTKVENYETVRELVLKDLQYTFPTEKISNVLILDVGKQQL